MILSISYAANPRRPRFILSHAAGKRTRQNGKGNSAFAGLLLRSTHKLVVIDHASDSALVAFGLFSADHTSLAAHAHVLLAANNVRGERNLEFNVRSDFQLSVGVNVHAGSAHVLRGA